MDSKTASTLECFCKIVGGIMGGNIVELKGNSFGRNSVTSALASDDYKLFRRNFKARLRRLASVYPLGKNRGTLVNLLRETASVRNWQGAYSELVALDFLNYPLNTDASFQLEPVDIEIRLGSGSSLFRPKGSRSGPSTLDGFLPDFRIYYDVKALQSVHTAVLENMYRRIGKAFEQHRLTINAEFDADRDISSLTANVRLIENELWAALDADPNLTFLRSRIVDGLSHRILRGAGVLLNVGVYNPYRHAMNFWTSAFRDCHQFATKRPFVLVYVSFPWFNSTISEFRESNKTFYRAAARRIFCGASHDSRSIAAVLGVAAPRRVTFRAASKALSAILFLEDKSILGQRASEAHINGYLYLNPNATHKLSGSLFYDFAVCDLKLSILDDFESDNY